MFSSMVRDTLREFFESSAPAGVVAAFLFGSFAEDRAHAESDVDVAVLLDRAAFPTPRERIDLRVRLGAELVAALHRNEIDVVVLDDASPELARRILTEGVLLACWDEEARLAAVRDASLRAADIAPFLRRMRGILLESLQR
jgi:predicted nucleotidyltransferase